MKSPIISYEYDGSIPIGRYYGTLARIKKNDPSYYSEYRSGLKNSVDGTPGEYDGKFVDVLKRPIDRGR